MFVFFKNLKLKYNPAINTVAASTFGVLLIHANSNTMIQWLWKATLNNAGAFHTDMFIVHAICSVVGIYIVLPGGRLGTKNLAGSEIVKEKCIEYAKDRMLAAICAAPSIFAELGLLTGKRATCHPDYEGKMGDAIITHESVTVDGNIITGQGLGATFEFAFDLIKTLVSEDKVEKIKKGICYYL